MKTLLTKSLAVLTLFALAACGGGSGSSSPSVTPPQSGAGILGTIVGVGDSLTAGTQSGTTMGENGTSPISPLPGNITPATQENGFFSILFQQAKSVSYASMYNPATSPLPLIHQPGVGGQVLFTANGPAFTHTSYDAFSQAGYALSSALSTVRISATQSVTDVAVPGQTTHEALTMTNPLTGPPGPANPCSGGYSLNPADPSTALQAVVNSESANFYPVLGGFANSVTPLTQVNAAVSLHPTLATVWLGGNDMLKTIFSAGQAPVADSPAQMQTDITTIIQRLQATGARVAVANLPTVLTTAQFFAGGVPANPAVPSQSVFYYLQAFSKGAITPAQAVAVVTQLQTQYGVGSGGYLTLNGLFTVLQELLAAKPINLDPCDPVLGQSHTGTGSLYIPDTFATQMNALNAAYNSAIGAAATTTGAALVDINAAFNAINAAGGYKLSNGSTVSLRYGKGLLSFDGIHPSNVGYAVIADAFIQAIDKAYSLTIAPVDPAAYQATDPYQIPQIP